MNPKFTPFIEQANLIVTNPLQKLAITTSAVALAISNTQHLPSSIVENPIEYFNINLLTGIKSIVSEWNESIILDIKVIIEQVRIFWLVRYTAAYPLSRVVYSAKGDFFSTVNGVYNYVPPVLLDFLNGEDRITILLLSNTATTILLTKDAS